MVNQCDQSLLCRAGQELDLEQTLAQHRLIDYGGSEGRHKPLDGRASKRVAVDTQGLFGVVFIEHGLEQVVSVMPNAKFRTHSEGILRRVVHRGLELCERSK